jgi:hypothetical protein
MSYDKDDCCLNCCAHFSEAHEPGCPMFKQEEESEAALDNQVFKQPAIRCGDCLRPECAGCVI